MPKELSADYRAGWRDAMTLFGAVLDLVVAGADKEGRKPTMKDIRLAAERHKDDAPRFTR